MKSGLMEWKQFCFLTKTSNHWKTKKLSKRICKPVFRKSLFTVFKSYKNRQLSWMTEYPKNTAIIYVVFCPVFKFSCLSRPSINAVIKRLKHFGSCRQMKSLCKWSIAWQRKRVAFLLQKRAWRADTNSSTTSSTSVSGKSAKMVTKTNPHLLCTFITFKVQNSYMKINIQGVKEEMHSYSSEPNSWKNYNMHLYIKYHARITLLTTV